MSAMQKHIEAIKAGKVTKTNVIGLRKAINAWERIDRGLSVSRAMSKVTFEDIETAGILLDSVRPLVVGELHDSGVKVLNNPRHKRALAGVKGVIENLAGFRLVGFEWVGKYQMHVTPIYEAFDTRGRTFCFINLPWQSGGKGPEVL